MKDVNKECTLMGTEVFDAIPDVQNSGNFAHIRINQVGIKSLRYPLQFVDRDPIVHTVVAHCSMFVDLSADRRGTHMSRFVEILQSLDFPISLLTFPNLLNLVVSRLNSQTAELAFEFPFFRVKKAPVSQITSLMDYNMSLSGRISADGVITETLSVEVPVTMVCPCSKQISRYGAHNQRSHVRVSVDLKDPTASPLWVTDLIDMVETAASSQLYGLLKRRDERYVTEHGYDNPKFVEDVIRDLAVCLNKRRESLLAYRIESENFESIHNHSAFARIEYTFE